MITLKEVEDSKMFKNPEKVFALLEYLELLDSDKPLGDLIEEVDDCTFNCENDVYEVYTDWEIDEQLDDARTLLEEQAISEIPLRYVDFFDAEGYAESVYENENDLFEDLVNYDGFTIVLE